MHAKCIHFKTVFARVFHAFTKVKIAHKNADSCTFFFKFVYIKCLKTQAICINLKTDFTRVLNSYTKVKINHKNAILCTFFFFFQTCLHKVSQSACKMHSFQDFFCTCFSRIYQRENCSKKRHFFTRFFSNLCPQNLSKRMQNALISKRFVPVFCTHLPNLKLLTKTLFFARFLKTCLHKVSQNTCKMHSF